ncbi:MAG: response regulator, partial [Armatimonadetes bacterium]|nr:response regulator [Armatimonadota bacterium]
GIPVCTEIKADPLTSRAQIVIVSARTESDFIAASIEAGATEYITKPFQPADLVRRVRRILRKEPAEGDAMVAEADEICPEPVR